MIQTFRVRDMNVERELARFLDKHLYNNGYFSKAVRTDLYESQMTGSDIILSIPKIGIENAVVDEKGQTQYIPALPTFALELSFLSSNGGIIEGWLTDIEKKTEYYLLIWIQDAGGKKWNLKSSDFKKIDYVLVRRADIINYLSSNGYTTAKLREKAKEIRNAGISGPIDKGVNSDFYFFYTTKLVEQPINIVIRRVVYERLAVLKGTIET